MPKKGFIYQKTLNHIEAIRSMATTHTVAEIARELGLSLCHIYNIAGAHEIHYLQGAGRVGPAAKVLLKEVGTGKTESEIARLAGVSRQRIHQLEQRFQVCRLIRPGYGPDKPTFCSSCGKKIDYGSKSGLCRKCFHAKSFVKLACHHCGREFTRRACEFAKCRAKKYQSYCSRGCFKAHRRARLTMNIK